MRIIYYHKFLYRELLNDEILQNCRLVIDGHSFFYDIYEKAKLTYEFGCEANEFARCLLRRPLNMFRKSNIKCFFVFKGGDNDINEKIPKLKATHFDINSNNRYVAPIFLREVCLQILEEVGIPYSTCVTDTVDACVALAQMFSCPVLSMGTEYYFRRTPFVPSDSLRYSDPNDYIVCKQYDLNDFLIFHSLTKRKTAIFAALTDIHRFPQNHFADLFIKWDVFHEFPNLMYKKLFKWLSEHSEDEAVSSIKEFLSSEVDTERFCNEVSKIVENMQSENESVVSDYLYNICRFPTSLNDPLWFEKGVASQNIAIPYINLCKHKFILGSNAIEKIGPTDSIVLSIDIIKYAYNLLTNFQETDIFVYQDAENYFKVNTGDTRIRKPIYECSESVFENGWDEIKRLELFEYFLTKNGIDIDKKNVPESVKLLLIALTYFARKKISEGIKVTKEVYCFIVCYAILEHLLVSYNKSNATMCSINGLDIGDYNEARRSTRKYCMTNPDEVKQIFDADVLKPLVELQHCLLHMNYLNTLCGAPYIPTKYHTTFNGTFIFKLLRDMADCEPIEFINDLFQTAPSILNYVYEIIIAYETLTSHIVIN